MTPHTEYLIGCVILCALTKTSFIDTYFSTIVEKPVLVHFLADAVVMQDYLTD